MSASTSSTSGANAKGSAGYESADLSSANSAGEPSPIRAIFPKPSQTPNPIHFSQSATSSLPRTHGKKRSLYNGTREATLPANPWYSSLVCSLKPQALEELRELGPFPLHIP